MEPCGTNKLVTEDDKSWPKAFALSVQSNNTLPK